MAKPNAKPSSYQLEKRAFAFASSDLSRPSVCGLLATQHGYIATDGLRLAIVTGPRAIQCPDWTIVPPSVQPALKDGLPLQWVAPDPEKEKADPYNHIGKFTSGALECTVMARNFPDYTRVVPRAGSLSFFIDKAQLKAAIDMVQVEPWTETEKAILTTKPPRLGFSRKADDTVQCYFFAYKIGLRWHWAVSIQYMDRADIETEECHYIARRATILDDGQIVTELASNAGGASWERSMFGDCVLRYNLWHVVDAVALEPMAFFADTRDGDRRDFAEVLARQFIRKPNGLRVKVEHGEVVAKSPSVLIGTTEMHIVMPMRA